MLTTTPSFGRAWRVALAAVIAIALAPVAGCSTTNDANMPGMNHGSTSPTPAASTATGQPSVVEAFNDDDVMFASMMIAHHQQAVVMSDLLLAKDGIPTELVALAQKIKEAQAPEIARLSGLLASWGQDPSQPTHHHMTEGMMSQEYLDSLATATEAEAAKLYLTGMIEHHQGAVSMARDQVADGRSANAIQLAKRIITSQKREIAAMGDLLKRVQGA